MRKTLSLLAIPAVILALLAFSANHNEAVARDKEETMLVHNVFFTLKNRNLKDRRKLIEACKKYLTKHEGVVFFAAGPIVESLKRDVNDLEFDVNLTMVFKDKAAHDKYQTHKRHIQFIKENKGLWKKVRVFDSYTAKSSR